MTTTQSELEQQALAIPDQALALMIVGEETYRHATELLLTIKDLRKEIEATFAPIIEKAFAAHKEAVAQRKRHEEPLIKAEGILKPRMAAYLEEQESQRREAERKAQEAAQLQEAVNAEAMGDVGGVEAALNGYGVASVIVPSSVPKVEGISTRDVWSGEVTNLLALVRTVAEGKAPLEFLTINPTFLNQMARAMKQNLRYPGVRAVCTKTVAAGRR